MQKIKKRILIFVVSITFLNTMLYASKKDNQNQFIISSEEGKCSISFYEEQEAFSGVVKIANKVRYDVKRVTDGMPQTVKDLANAGESVVIYGTIGQSPVLETLAKSQLIDLEQIKNKNEVYSFTIIEKPFKKHSNIKKALVIAGSDKRGTIYGLFHLSELMGVSPLVDWADVQPLHKDSIILTANDNYISKEPSVKYRGFFINDEWPAFGAWANKQYGGINAKCYEHVFELLLRMHGNYFWPAMWSSCFSTDGPGLANAELADELGVVMGASHHEPCCRAGVEFQRLKGKNPQYGKDWNFMTNKDGVTEFWKDGLQRNGKFENVITVGMRGEADSAILGHNATLEDNINLLRDVLKTQNQLIRENVNPDLEKVPRMFALYKEVEPFFYGDETTKGLMDCKELEGVTLMLCDDNHGNLRTLPSAEMKNHKGGYGMYYHLDYHGGPVSYEWINTSFIPKIKEQMCMAYEFGVQDLWIVNVGDIATNEFPLNFFMDLAYDYQKYSADEMTGTAYTKLWTETQFAGLTADQKSEIEDILNGYTKLAHLRRTESIKSNTYSAINYNEADRVLAQAQKIMDKAEKLKAEIPTQSHSELYSPFYSQVYYPACGTMNVLKMMILAGKNEWFVKNSLPAATAIAEEGKKTIEFDKKLVNEYHSVDGGKWFGMGKSNHIGFKTWNDEGCMKPSFKSINPSSKKQLAVWIEGDDKIVYSFVEAKKPLTITSFANPETNVAVIKIADLCSSKTKYKIENEKSGKNSWLSFEIKENPDLFIDSVHVVINREKLSLGSDKKDAIKITGKDEKGKKFEIPVLVDAAVPDTNYSAGTFIQTGSYISIEAAHFIHKEDGKTDDGQVAAFKELPDYGKTLSAYKVFPVTEYFDGTENTPYLEYNFVLNSDGKYAFRFYMNPSNPVTKDNKLQFLIDLNGEKQIIDIVKADYAVGDGKEPWSSDVMNNIRTHSCKLMCKKGLNSIKIYPVTPGFVFEKLVISESGTTFKQSYLGPEETFFIK